ncbi:MAG: BrnT family toxin [Acetobacteraceae bacterium]|nr:BrnT family toxin [Acetobacteraceae bacterium]
MRYEWDEAKNASNIAKHGVSFALAQRIFEGVVLTMIDDRLDYGEPRNISIGTIDGVVLLAVVHTDRSGRVRIISARRASQRERQSYDQATR